MATQTCKMKDKTLIPRPEKSNPSHVVFGTAKCRLTQKIRRRVVLELSVSPEPKTMRNRTSRTRLVTTFAIDTSAGRAKRKKLEDSIEKHLSYALRV